MAGKTAICSLAEKTIAVIVFARGLHDRENRAGSRRLLRFFIVASNVSSIILLRETGEGEKETDEKQMERTHARCYR